MNEQSVAHEEQSCARFEHHAKLPAELANLAEDCKEAVGLAFFYLSIGRRPPEDVPIDASGRKRTVRFYLSPAAERFREQLMQRHSWSKSKLFTEALRLISANPVLKGGRL